MRRILAILSTFATTFSLAAPAFAETSVNPCPSSTSGTTGFAPLCNLQLVNALPQIITAVIIIAVVIALAFLIWGGIKWILSGGDKGKVEGARSTIIGAIIGLVIVFLSFFILNIVLAFFTGGAVNLMQLTLPTINATGSAGGVGCPPDVTSC